MRGDAVAVGGPHFAEGIDAFVGQLRVDGASFKIASRAAVIDAMELGSLASVSFIL